jgi:hypothetical protein
MVSGPICLANGCIAFVRTRRIPMVSSVAAAISVVGLDAADHRLDCEHLSYVRHVALARAWASVGSASWLGHARGIRMRDSSRRNSRTASVQTTGGNAMLNGLSARALPHDHNEARNEAEIMEHGDRLNLSIERWGRRVTIEVKHGKIKPIGNGEHKVVIVIEYPEANTRKPKRKGQSRQ